MKIGFIGCGNMGFAMMQGIVDSGKASANDIIASDVSEELINDRKEKLGIEVTVDNKMVASKADMLFLAVKPQYYETVIKEIAGCVNDKKIIVTIAPGKTLEWLAKTFDNNDLKIVRTMPNTPAMVSEGVLLFENKNSLNSEEREMIMELFSATGLVVELPSNLMGIGGAILDTTSNYYITLRYKPRHLTWLHCMWGVGASILASTIYKFLS